MLQGNYDAPFAEYLSQQTDAGLAELLTTHEHAVMMIRQEIARRKE